MSGDKKWTRRAAIGLIGAGTGLFAAETAGISMVEADRDTNLGTSNDPSALLGVGTNTGPVTGKGEKVLATLTNNFGVELDSVSVSFQDQPELVSFVSRPGSLEPNDTEDVVIDLSCGSSERITIEIIASGPDHHVELSREFTVNPDECNTGCPVTVDDEDALSGSSIDGSYENGQSGQVVINNGNAGNGVSGDIDIDSLNIKINNVSVSGGVSGQEIIINPNSSIGGKIDASGPVEIKPNSVVCQSGNDAIVSEGDVTIDGRVEGNIDAEGAVTVNGTVTGNIDAGGAVTVNGTVTVQPGNDAIVSEGDVTIDGRVEGNIDADGGGSVVIRQNGRVEGNIDAEGNINNEGTHIPNAN